MRHGLLAAALGAAVLAVGAARAEALTCVFPDGGVMAGAQHAFIGTLLAQDGATLTFRVDEVARGKLPAQIVVRDTFAPPPGMPGWGLRIPIGAQVGLAVGEWGGAYSTNACSMIPPARLRFARDEGWDPGVAGVAVTSARVRGRRVKVLLRCYERCVGSVELRARGVRLGRRRIALDAGRDVAAVRLPAAAARRLARGGRVAARVTVRLGSARDGSASRPLAVPVTLRRP
jgi:hypothetical protein